MKLLIIADTHNDFPALKKVLHAHSECDLVIHCGDGEKDIEQFRREFPGFKAPVEIVRGNCDFNTSIPERFTLDLPYGHRLVATHGHLFMAGDFRSNLVRLARSEQADLVLFGHTHSRYDRRVERVQLFNPGSASRPRDGLEPSYGLIDITEGGMLFSHGEVPKLVL